MNDDASADENSGDSFFGSGLVDDSDGLSFENISYPDPSIKPEDYDDILSDNPSSSSEDLTALVIEELEEEEILISLDIV